MLKLLSSSCRQGILRIPCSRLPGGTANVALEKSPFFRVIRSLRSSTGEKTLLRLTASFSSKSGDGDGDAVKSVDAKAEEEANFSFIRAKAEAAALSAKRLPMIPWSEDHAKEQRRLNLLLELIMKKIEISKIQESIAKAIEETMSELKHYVLNKEMKAIMKELGLETDDKTALSAKFRERIEPKRVRCSPHVLQVIEEKLADLQLLETNTSEFTRFYLEWFNALPWGDD